MREKDRKGVGVCVCDCFLLQLLLQYSCCLSLMGRWNQATIEETNSCYFCLQFNTCMCADVNRLRHPFSDFIYTFAITRDLQYS